jgi:hypothetical protein
MRIGLLRVHILEEHGAGQPVATIDPHSIRATHAVRAGAAERQRAVDLPLDLMQRIENANRRVEIIERVILKIRLRVFLGIVALDSECCCHVLSENENSQRLDFNSRKGFLNVPEGRYFQPGTSVIYDARICNSSFGHLFL